MRASIAYFIVRIVAWCIQQLPLKVALALADFVATVVYYLDPRKGIAYSNLKAALGAERTGPELRRISRHAYVHLGRLAIEVLRFPVIDKHYVDEYVQMDGEDKLKSAFERKKGVIISTAHTGNWELGQIALSLMGYPMKVVTRPQAMVKLNDLLNSYRSVVGTETIARGMGMREAIRTLRRGEILAMVQGPSAPHPMPP